ncbi:Cytochrome oxidase Cu insertion factor, SCO1/SenC/PrrC family [Algoriphagus locisalis]|uniref:Cytochrome oxidase Cu insertion factor, SCO1/SenC/PrrC family n=1 Tax=Algoriphagus locisalis TaxID=305507 RepID=A0A1I7CA98_9BACT|nr:TlpA disulfide reductase family protein [Algoriphagus locisalis]SFT96371.1 Cytochrome oxidase Cu insertion factor, SCO1/SenC/PrrC family [Algoriphagus locisalis]
MKKHLFTCFLASLCLYGSTSTAQVADSPGADFLHRSSPIVPHELRDTHRGGETRSDTMPEGIDLVSQAGQGQEGESSSASVGALIYGELINPDSLSPLQITFTPYYLGGKSTFRQQVYAPEVEPGAFFDGVLDARKEKFRVAIPDLDRAGYLDLSLGNRKILSQYLLSPGDSLKIELDLLDLSVVFGGPAASFYQAQAALQSQQASEEFDQPRRLYLADNNPMLEEEGRREEWMAFQKQFGSQLEIRNFGRAGLEQLHQQWEGSENNLQGQLDVLQFYASRLSDGQRELLELEIYSRYYYRLLSVFHKSYYGKLTTILGEEGRREELKRWSGYLAALQSGDYSDESRLISAAFLELQLERVLVEALINGEQFHKVLNRQYTGELRDRIGAGFLTQNLRRYGDPAKVLEPYLSEVASQPWRDRLVQLKESMVPGAPLIPMELETLAGDTVMLADVVDQPTLLYFYFSTCTHSANYFKRYLWPLYQELADKEDFQLIGISADSDRELWQAALADYSSPELTNLRMTEDALDSWIATYEIVGFPRAFLLDSDGTIRAFKIGGSDYPQLKENFLELLGTVSFPSPKTASR